MILLENAKIYQLLLSDDDNELKRGLHHLEHRLGHLQDFALPLLLFLEFGDMSNWVEYDPLREKWQAIWDELMPAEVAKHWRSALGAMIYHEKSGNFSYNAGKPSWEAFEAEEDTIFGAVLQNPRYRVKMQSCLLKRASTTDIEPAYRFFQRRLEGNPANLNLQLEVCNFLINEVFDAGKHLDQLSWVEEVLRHGMEEYPQHRSNYLKAIAVLYDFYHSDKQKAKSLYREVIGIDPKNAGAMNNLAIILFKVDGNTPEALLHANEAVRLQPEDVSYLDTLGWINWKGLGNIDEAERLFKLCRRYDENEEHHASLTALGEVMVARKQFQKAEKYYRAGLKIKPEEPYKLLRMAELYCYHLNQKNLADGYCRHVLRLAPDNAEAKRIQADC